MGAGVARMGRFMSRGDCRTEIEGALWDRILVLDGAMGTTIREYGLREADVRGERFADCGRTCGTTAIY